MKKNKILKLAVLVSSLLFGMEQSVQACSSLAITDTKGAVYHGRTLELEWDMPSWLTYYPKGVTFQKVDPAGQKNNVRYQTKYEVIAITTEMINDGDDHNLFEGMNSAGLAFSANMVQSINIAPLSKAQYAEAIPISSIGEWALASFSTVQEVKEAVEKTDFWLPRLPAFGDVEAPLHFAFYDKQGGSIVVEAANGKFVVYDNPTRVLTNGPDFPWHLTNMNNYTQLNNVDRSEAKLANIDVIQPDSGIATSALPSSDTSVGRFIRAAYYVTYAEKANNPEQAMNTLAHIMNRFDRTKDISVDYLSEAGKTETLNSEYTVWTALADLTQGKFMLRGYNDINYQTFSFDQFKNETKPVFILVNLDPKVAVAK